MDPALRQRCADTRPTDTRLLGMQSAQYCSDEKPQPPFPTTTDSQTRPIAFLTTQTAVRKTTRHMGLPCSDTAVPAQGRGRGYTHTHMHAHVHTHTHTHHLHVLCVWGGAWFLCLEAQG